MSPHLRYAQAIHGRVTGRGTGIIDTLHLVEVARAAEVLAGAVLLPNQTAPDGSFPEELRRTKPYGYSLFNLEAMASLCQLLSTPPRGRAAAPPNERRRIHFDAADDDLWSFTLPDGRGMRRGMQFMAPYIRDKKSWPKPPDVRYDREWPMRQASLLFAGLAFAEPAYLDLWRKLPADSGVDEVIRNLFIRQPVLWIGGEGPRASPAGRLAEPVVVASPNKKVEIAVETTDEGLAYRVRLEGHPTWAHQIATAVVFTSPVLVYGGHPQSLLDDPAADVIKSIPGVRDETRVLAPGAIGELAVYARRAGDRWFLGVLNGKERRTLRVPLSFLGKGRYHATLVGDDRTNGAAVQMEQREVRATEFVDVPLRYGGGFVGRFVAHTGMN